MARKRYNFWLDEKNPGDWGLNDLIARLKKPAKGPGQFTRAIREGLRLWEALQKRDLSVVIAMHPWIVEAIRKMYSSDDGDMRRELADMKRLIMQQGSISSPPKDYPIMKPATPIMPIVASPPVPTAKVKKAKPISANDIAENFLSAFQ